MKLGMDIEELLNSDSIAEFLQHRYETQLKIMSIIMPITSALFIIIGIILLLVVKDFTFPWIMPGIMFIFSGTLFLGWFFIMRVIIKNQLNTIKKVIEKKELQKKQQKNEQV